MSTAATLTFESQCAILRLSRPEKHNAFDDQVIKDLRTHLATIKDSDARVMLLISDGKHFCAGADLSWMKRMAELTRSENLSDARNLASLMEDLGNLPIPTIVRVQGAAYGGAIGLIACCDIAIADQSARFCLSETKIGLAPATIGPFVVQAMGPRVARKLFLTAEVFSADAACRYGLIHEVVSDKELDLKVVETANQILKTGPNASRSAKELVSMIMEHPADIADRTSQLIADLRVSDEGQAGLSAFFEKKSAPWVSALELNHLSSMQGEK